jgi:hypothetical protein
MRLLRSLALLVAVALAACSARTPLQIPTFDVAMIPDDGMIAQDVRPEVVLPPANPDCTQRQNCNHGVCRMSPVCGDWVPGGCPPGQVHDAVTNQCRACIAADCDGLPSFCCMTNACAHAAACGLYVCAPIARHCRGLTSSACGIYDIDQDDAWGDCDEAVQDDCCACHVALGCFDSPCMFGQYVWNNDCATCTTNDCDEVSCMGLNGCPTNCARGMFFDGAHCRSCSTSGNQELIPACRML